MQEIKSQKINPITCLDYPDPDVIRVDDTYYLVSTTMHFMPGCEILRSYDLLNWEHLTYVYDRLDSTPAERLEGDEHIFGKGMWAACIRYHKGMFYICFVANDTRKTYLYTSKDIMGPWKKQIIEGFYHDCSLLFDDDGSIYIAYGNRNVYITQLAEDFSGPKEGGLHRLVVSDEGNPYLGYEGSHFYKLNGKYYLFFIHSRRDCWRRTEACFVADSLDGEFTGGDVLDDDRGYRGQGVAQGGIVDTPDGKWYAFLFQDFAAVGRIPILLPITWENDYPVFGEEGKVPENFPIISTRPDYKYQPLVQSDDFHSDLKSCWQFSHEPVGSLITHDMAQGIWSVKTDKTCSLLTNARNIITQRMRYPSCSCEVTVDGSGLKDGDSVGLCAFQGIYGFVGLTRKEGKQFLTVRTADVPDAFVTPISRGPQTESESVLIPMEQNSATIRMDAVFDDDAKDTAQFFYRKGEGTTAKWEKVGPDHKLYFRLDHFTGARFGLVMYSTKEAGGTGSFREFVYHE